MLVISRFNNSSEGGGGGGWKVSSEGKHPMYHKDTQRLTTQRICLMIIRIGSQFLKHQLLQRITAQP